MDVVQILASSKASYSLRTDTTVVYLLCLVIASCICVGVRNNHETDRTATYVVVTHLK